MGNGTKTKSKTEIRRELILEKTIEQGHVTVEMLAELLGVSAQTVRRDINQLCSENLLRRKHGGVESFEQQLNEPYQQRAVTNFSAKWAIAQAVAKEIPDGSTVFISIGSTPAIVAEALTVKSGLTVMTNNLNAAMVLSNEPSNRIIIPGGEVRMPDRDVLGDGVLDFLTATARNTAFSAWRVFRKMVACWIFMHLKSGFAKPFAPTVKRPFW